MKTDRELLELAAKAAGMNDWSFVEAWGAMAQKRLAGGFYFYRHWNPLTDDGDALRLAVKLGIEFHIEGGSEDEVVWANDVMLWTNGNTLSTSRRAIVLAAVAIGESMP